MKISSLSSCLLCSCRCQCRSKREILTLRHSVSSKAHVIKYISLYSQCDARTLKNKTYKYMSLALKTLYSSGRWSFQHCSLWDCWLSLEGGSDNFLGLWSAQSRQTAHTQKSFSLGCVHKRVSVHKHRPRFCPWLDVQKLFQQGFLCCFNPFQGNQISWWYGWVMEIL